MCRGGGRRFLEVMKMTNEKFNELSDKVKNYFENDQNKPFCMSEICEIFGVSYETLSLWERDKNKKLADLIRSSKLKVVSGWEKGEINATLAGYLHKTYFPQQATENNDISISIKVVDSGGD